MIPETELENVDLLLDRVLEMHPTAYLLLLSGTGEILAALTNTPEERLGWHVTGNETNGIDARGTYGVAADGTVIDDALVEATKQIAWIRDEDTPGVVFGNLQRTRPLHASNLTFSIRADGPGGIYDEP